MIERLVSTIIPVHNRAKLLEDAVSSVLNQTYRPIEIIIVDDGSTDNTAQLARSLASSDPDAMVSVISQPNRGPGAARENGKQMARGQFIQYLDSDDILLPRKFEWQVEGLSKHPQCGISYGKTRYCAIGESNPIPWKRTGERIEHVFPAMLKSRWWGTSTPLYRRAILDQAGPWLDLRSEEDWEYDCRIGMMGVALHYVPEFVSEEHEHPGDRLSRAGTSDPRKLRDIAKARHLIYQHAVSAGLSCNVPEMRHFSRELFLLSRQCGAANLREESRGLFALAKRAAGSERAKGLDFLLYGIAASILGWPLVGRLACASDRLRR